jgi:hypothetical protein
VSVYTRPRYLRHVVPETAGWRPPDWTDLAVCAQVGGDEWFPEDGQQAPEATALCRSCPSRIPCLEAGLDGNEEGIWGGFGQQKRHEVRRLRNQGTPLEDIIADDDARHYARIEARAAAIEARGGTHEDRRSGMEREKRQANREAVELAAGTITKPRKAAA